MATTTQGRSRSARRRATSRARGTGSAARSRARAARANGRPAEAANGATGTVEQVVDKAKGPALAGGAALAAIAAGGVVLARSGRRGKGLSSLPVVGRKRHGVQMPHVELPHISMPHLPHRSNGETKDALRATAKALGAAAVEVGKAGYRAGELAAEVRRVREQAARRDA